MPAGTARRGLLRGAALAPSLLAAGCVPGGLSDGAATAEVATERDIAYAPQPWALLDLYRPVAPAVPLPLIIYFHGGGWQGGHKDELPDLYFARRLAARGALVASAAYRLLPEARFPNFLQDGAAAAAWLHQHAPGHGGDPGRLFFAGHSAGAYNAVMLTLDRRYVAAAGLPPAAVRRGIGLAGPYADRWLDWGLGTLFPPAMRQEASIRRHLGPGSPPLLLLTGSRDLIVPPRDTRRLAEAARAAGAPVEAVIYPGFGHLDILAAAPWLPSAAPVVSDVMRFVREVSAA